MKRYACISLIIILFFSAGDLCAYEVKSLKDAGDTHGGAIVEVPEIRKKLQTPITVDFRGVNLDYVLDFLSDATGVNIISGSTVDPSEKKVTMRVKDKYIQACQCTDNYQTLL